MTRLPFASLPATIIPNHDTIAAFRKRFIGHIEPLFVEVLKLASAMGMLKLGTVALDGTKVHANASRHSALSYGHAKKLEKRLRKEVHQLLRLAEQADADDIPDGMSIPEELERREVRLAAIAEPKAKIEARIEQHEQAEYQAKLAAKEEQQKCTGKKPRGRPPEPPSGTVGEKEQINLTNEDSRIMPVPGGGFDQSYNAQALVAAGSLLVVALAVTEAPNDKEQLAPMIGKLKGLPKELGRPKRLLTDSGYLSEANVERCAAAGIEPLIAIKRERHHRTWRQRFAAAPKPPPTSATAMQSVEDSGGAQALCPAQANAGTGVRHPQSDDGISAISLARPGKRARRMELGDDELEPEAMGWAPPPSTASNVPKWKCV